MNDEQKQQEAYENLALVPNKVKMKKGAESGVTPELIVGIIVIAMLVDRFLSGMIHAYLSWALILIALVVIAYLIFPNDKNVGHVGYVRFLNLGGYYLEKWKKWRKIK